MEPVGKRDGPRKLDWFDVGESLLFLVIGLLLLGRGLWHAVLHHELLLKTFVSSALFCAVGVLFGIQGLKSKRPSRGRPRGKVSKRHRRIPFFVLLLVLTEPSTGRLTGWNGFVIHGRTFVCMSSCLFKAVAHRNSAAELRVIGGCTLHLLQGLELTR